jgi:hypothetical protein
MMNNPNRVVWLARMQGYKTVKLKAKSYPGFGVGNPI